MPLDYDVPFDKYLATPGVHFSALAKMALSPLHYRRARDSESPSTDAQRIGTLAHSLTLTPDALQSFVVFPGKTRRGKAWDDFETQAEIEGQTIVTAQELSGAQRIAAAVRAHGPAMDLLREGHPEVTATWDDEVPIPSRPEFRDRIGCRARFDWLNPGAGLVELKTTRFPPIPRAWAAEVARRYYHVQLAHYAAGLEALWCSGAPAWWIVVENVPPYDVAVYRAPTETLEAGERLRQKWLAQIAACEATGRWPGVGGDEALTFALPDYAATEGLEDIDMSGIEGGDDGES